MKRASLICFGMLLATRAAFADDADATRKATAETLFEEAQSAVAQGKYAEACPKLAESERIDPGIGTQLWLADCYENNGQTATAWITFKGAADAAARKSDEREHVARDRAAALEKHLSRLVIVVPPDVAAIPGLEVRRDGIPMASVLWGSGVPVDPGKHDVSARAPDHREWSSVENIEPGKSVEVVVTLATAEIGSTADTPARTEMKEGASSSPASAGQTQRWLGIGVAGAGVIAAGLATYWSFSAKSAYDDSNANAHCSGSNACDAIGAADRQSAFNKAAAATVSYIAGGVLVVGGLTLYLTAPRSKAIAVTVMPSLGGLSTRVTW